MNPPFQHLSARCRWAALSAVTVAIASTATCQTNWVLNALSPHPPSRGQDALAYDSQRDRVVYFGSGTWELSVNGWAQRTPSLSPTSRILHAMAFDSSRGRTLLFGGQRSDLSLSDTWQWDGSNTWTAIATPTGAPPARWGHAMAYDTLRARIVLFGGRNEGTTIFSDTWEWDGGRWLQRNVTPRPAGRSEFTMAYDSASFRTVLFGGLTSTARLSDTWEWTGTAWISRSPGASPSARSGHAMAYDAARGRVVLFGGIASNLSFLSDTWEWDGTTWSVRNPSAHPTARYLASMAYDSARDRTVLWGGVVAPLPTETWIYRPDNPAAFLPFGTACPGSAGTPVLSNFLGSLPWVGDTFRTWAVSLATADGTALFVTGLHSTPAQNLAFLGLPACSSFVSADFIDLAVVSDGVATWSINVPNNPALVGARMFQQVIAIDITAPGGAVVTNAGEMVAGAR